MAVVSLTKCDLNHEKNEKMIQLLGYKRLYEWIYGRMSTLEKSSTLSYIHLHT